MIPNIAAAIANSPKLINSHVGVFQQVHSSSLTEQEIQIVLLTDAVASSSTYAVAFHTTLALQQGVGSEETDAIRERRAPADKRFAALSTLAKTLIEKRGHLSEQELRWNNLQPSAGGAFPAARLAGLAAENETGEPPLMRLRPISIRIGGNRDGNAIHSGSSSTR